MLVLAAFLVVAWLPGAVLFRVPWFDRPRRAQLAAEERLYWTVVLSVVGSLAWVLVLAAAHRYSFRALLVADSLTAVVVAAMARFDLRLGPSARWPGTAALVPLALVILSAWRFLPPSEYVIGGKDPGVYLNEGIQIAQRGGLIVADETVAAVPAFARPLFFPTDVNRPYYLSLRFMGFYIRDPDTGAVISQFQHAFPAAIAIGYGLGGLTGARRAVVACAMLGVLGLYFAGARLFGRPTAAAAATLLVLNVIELWFARYPNVEVLIQALLIASLLAAARAQVDGDPFFAPVTGVLLGMLLFTRFDAALVVVTVIAAQALGYVALTQRMHWTFWPALAIPASLCGWYLVGPMRAYSELPLAFVARLPWGFYAAFVAGSVALLAIVVSAHRSPWTATRVRQLVPAALAVIVTLLAVYAFEFRHPGDRLAAADADALRTFAIFYVTVPALIAAVIGYAVIGRTVFWRDPALLLTFTAFSLFFFYKLRIVPVHFWAARRFVPIILPGTLLLAAAAALAGVRGRWQLLRVLRVPIAVVFLGLLAVNYARASRPVADHVEYAGVIPKLEQIASGLADDDLLIVESRNASDVHVLALPLAYIYARQVLVLSSPAPDKPTFAGFLNWARSRYRRVLFMGGGGTDLLSSQWSVRPISSERFQIPEYDAPNQAYPQGVRRKEFDYSLYAFEPAVKETAPFELDVGVSDDLNVIRFHAKERTDTHTFRWSQDQSFIVVSRFRPQDRTLALWMSNGGRPPAAPPADVSVRVGDRLLGSVRVGDGFSEYDLAIPPDLAGSLAERGEPVRLVLRSTVWNPYRVLGLPDDRDLGVMVDRVAVR